MFHDLCINFFGVCVGRGGGGWNADGSECAFGVKRVFRMHYYIASKENIQFQLETQKRCIPCTLCFRLWTVRVEVPQAAKKVRDPILPFSS